MSTPWSIEFNKNVLGGIHDNLIEGFSNENFNGFVLRGWDFLTFENWCKFSTRVVIVEF
jgi:hypothetical protein